MRNILDNLVWFVTFAAISPVFGQSALQTLLQRVENRYNKPKTMQIAFEQSSSGGGMMTRTERGELYLEKPGKMRWEYSEPAGKLFLTDGKFVYYYSPSTGRAERSVLKESDDLRAPLAFLMGRLDFYRDFREFRTYKEGQNTYIVATPKSERAPYTQVAFTVNPESRIEMLRVTGQDQSILVYRLSNERLNPKLAPGTFVFKAPPGVQVVDEQP